jgi:alpha-mannosidase
MLTPFLLWNPHPFPFRGPVELEANLDYRPIWKYENRVADLPVEVRGPDSAPVPFQRVHTEHESMPNLPWRVRALVNADIPPFGWAVYDMGYREDAIAPEIVGPPVSVADGIVDNGLYRVEAGVGKPGIAVLKQDTSIFGNEGLSFVTVEDHYGSWGSMDEAPESQDLQDVRCKWTIEQVETLQAGKLRGTLWVRLTGGRSTLELTISLHAGRDAVDIAARLLWDDRSARVKMIMPVDGGEQAEFDVPGATVKRERNSGEVPGGRWVRVPASQGAFGFASDSLYNFNYKNGALQATIARGSRYAADTTIGMRDEVWTPAVDRGELKFRFLLTLGSADLQALARVLESPVIVQTVPASSGTLPRSGSFGSIKPDTLKLLAFKPADDGNGMIVRVQNATEHDIDAVCTLFGIDLPLGNVPSGHISSWRVARDGNGWTATAADSTA